MPNKGKKEWGKRKRCEWLLARRKEEHIIMTQVLPFKSTVWLGLLFRNHWRESWTAFTSSGEIEQEQIWRMSPHHFSTWTFLILSSAPSLPPSPRFISLARIHRASKHASGWEENYSLAPSSLLSSECFSSNLLSLKCCYKYWNADSHYIHSFNPKMLIIGVLFLKQLQSL